MTVNEYISFLEKNLEGLPYEEKQNAIEYWREYFAEVPEEELENEMNKIGTPYNLANQIRKDGGYAPRNPLNQPETKEEKDNSRTILMIILLVLLSPIWISILAVVFSVVLSIVAVLISFAITIPLIGIGAIISAVPLLGYNIYSAIFDFGAGVFFIGLTVLLEKPIFIGIKNVVLYSFKAVKGICKKIFKK